MGALHNKPRIEVAEHGVTHTVFDCESGYIRREGHNVLSVFTVSVVCFVFPSPDVNSVVSENRSQLWINCCAHG